MARGSNRLMATEVEALLRKGPAGRYLDGDGLYLVVTSPVATVSVPDGHGGTKQRKTKGRGWWMLRYMAATRSKTGKPMSREMGLGAADPDGALGFTLAHAREKADDARRLLRDGIDPLAHRDEAAAAKRKAKEAARLFKDVAEAFIAGKEAGWQNEKHAAQWRATLATYVYPTLGDMQVAAIAMEDVKGVLTPIWTKKPETASRVRGRIEAVLDYAEAHNWRQGPNPARWKGNLAFAFPTKTKVAKVEHHAALPWVQMSAFLNVLRQQSGTAARALEFLILTAARTGEVIGARWSEIDMAGGVWTIPASRMKADKEHRIPLSAQALAVLMPFAKARDAETDGFVFPGQFADKGLSNMSMLKVLERMKRTDLTVHGFRSTFRDWAGEATAHPREVIEHALAHLLKDKAEAAYQRGDLFRKRAALMQDWAEFCDKPPATVTALRPGMSEASA